MSLAKLRAAHGYATVIGLITCVGNRQTAFYREIAELAARSCDYLMVSAPADAYLRTRSKAQLIAELEHSVPTPKRLTSMDGDCAEIILHLNERHPGRTLFVLFNARGHAGIDNLLDEAQPIDFN